MILTGYNCKTEVIPIQGYKFIVLKSIDEKGNFMFSYYPIVALVNTVNVSGDSDLYNNMLPCLAIGFDAPARGYILTLDGSIIDTSGTSSIGKVYEDLDELEGYLNRLFVSMLPEWLSGSLTCPFTEEDVNYSVGFHGEYVLDGLDEFIKLQQNLTSWD